MNYPESALHRKKVGLVDWESGGKWGMTANE